MLFCQLIISINGIIYDQTSFSHCATARAVVAAVQARSGALTYGSSGNGSSPHLAVAVLANATGTTMTHVSFRGNAPAMAEVMAGRVDFMFYPMVGIARYIEARKLKALAIGTVQPSTDFLGAPKMADALGVQGFEHTAPWVGILAPKGTPAAVVAKLNQSVQSSLASAEVKKQLKEMGAVVAGGSAQDFSRFLAEDTERWAKLVKATNITGD